jgi:ABC-type multidrug transport system ATPase subunit
VTLNEGKIEWILNDKRVSEENIFQQIAIVAPYLELIEEYTAKEFLQFHSQFKSLKKNISIEEILETVGLKTASDKQIRFYSSGMKQRMKLAQAVFTDVPLLLLDEPCTNLDAEGYALYHSLINNHCTDKTIVVSSNDVNEYDFCERKVSITDYKRKEAV